MNLAVPTWHITRAVQCDDGWSVELERGDESALATLSIEDRGGRPGQPADWRVFDVECDDADAREWLDAAEHEYAISERCFDLAVAS